MNHQRCPRCNRPAETGRDRWGPYICCLVCGTIEITPPLPEPDEPKKWARGPSAGGRRL